MLLLRNHISFFILLISSLALFLINIFLKATLEYQDYSMFGILVSFFSIIVTFGFLGTEQSILRLSKVKKSFFFIPKQVITTLMVSTIFFLMITIFIMNKYYLFNLSFLLLMIVSLQIQTLSSIYYRIKKQWNVSQLFGNSWKFFSLLLIIIIYFTKKEMTFYDVEVAFSIVFTILSLVVISKYNKLKIIYYTYEKKEINQLNFNFFFSILLITILSFSDRFLIEIYLGQEVFAEYFFYLSIIFYPFSLLQGYIGFKELPLFKEKFNSNLLSVKIKKIFILALILSTFIIICINLVNLVNIQNIKFDNLNLVYLLIILGIVKLFYSLFSAVFGAITNANNIRVVNRRTILVFIIILVYFYSVQDLSVVFLLSGFIILWILRSLFIYIEIKNILNTEKIN